MMRETYVFRKKKEYPESQIFFCAVLEANRNQTVQTKKVRGTLSGLSVLEGISLNGYAFVLKMFQRYNTKEKGR